MFTATLIAMLIANALFSRDRRADVAPAFHHRDNRKRFTVRADEKLTAFVELESSIYRAIATTIG